MFFPLSAKDKDAKDKDAKDKDRTDDKDVEEALPQLKGDFSKYKRSFNTCPWQFTPVLVRGKNGGRVLQVMKWGTWWTRGGWCK